MNRSSRAKKRISYFGFDSASDQTSPFGDSINSETEVQVQLIEVDLRSPIKELILLQEKWKLLLNGAQIKVVEKKLSAELDRLTKFITPEQYQAYVKYIIQQDALVTEKIENECKSNIGELLLKQMETRSNKVQCRVWNKALSDEWERLINYIPGHGITIYLINIFTTYSKAQKTSGF